MRYFGNINNSVKNSYVKNMQLEEYAHGENDKRKFAMLVLRQ